MHRSDRTELKEEKMWLESPVSAVANFFISIAMVDLSAFSVVVVNIRNPWMMIFLGALTRLLLPMWGLTVEGIAYPNCTDGFRVAEFHGLDYLAAVISEQAAVLDVFVRSLAEH
jgi:hypothetical protein